MHFLRLFSGCCGLCLPIRYSATAGRPADRRFRDNSACCLAQEQTRNPEALLTRTPNAGSVGLNSIHADGLGQANGTARNVHRRVTRPGEIK